MPQPNKGGGYDPNPKKKRTALILWILEFLGLKKEEDIPPVILAWLLWKTAQDIIRDVQTEFITEAALTSTKDWNVEDENACDYCLQAASNSPYPNDFYLETHPNCRCWWTPHIE